ncbi:MAG: hypothetical protein AAB757_03315 [Patescibacteria group bacterium]|mgnify:FL=1
MNQYQKEYAGFLEKFLVPQPFGKLMARKPLKVVFDCSNGAAGPIIERIMNYELRIKKKNKSAIRNPQFIIINSKLDGNFPAHGPNPLVKNAMEQIKKSVLKHKADLGVIFDADGDRAFFIDDKGRFVDPDEIAYLLIWSLKPKKIVYDVRTGWLVRRIMNNELRIKNKKGKTILHNSKFIIHESRVGHYFIKKLMREKDIGFGCEQSGHYYFKKFFYADSGILAAIEVINAVSKLPYKFSDFIDLLPRYFRSGELNIKMNYELGIKNYEYLLKQIENKYKNRAIKISRIDGLSIEFGDFWFNIRPSNTEPLARLNVEAIDKKTLAKQTKILLGLLRK